MSVALSEHLPLLASAPDGVAKLRNFILGLAISGKLVTQDENDQPAWIAFEQFRIPRKPPVEPLLKKFQIPSSWIWCEVGEVNALRTGATPSTHNAENFGGDIRWLVSGDIHKREIFDCDGRITEQGIASSNCKILPEGSVLIALNGQGKTRATVAILRVPAACNQSLVAMTPVTDELLLPEFLYLNLRFRYYEIRDITGQKQRRGLNMGLVGDLSISLPPLAEQHRIVAKVDELMALCDRLEAEQSDAAAAHERLVATLLGTLTQSTNAADLAANWQRLAEHFDTLFTTEASLDALKQTILQLAVMGKLVPQDPNDEPASELLKRIAKERARLEAEGICKKSIPMPLVGEDERLFALPEGWEWVRIGSIAEIRGGKRLPAGHNYSPIPTEHIYIQVTNMKNGTILQDDLKYIDQATYTEIARYTISADDLYVTIAGTIGQVGCVPQSFDGMNLTENAAKLSSNNLDRLGLRMILSAPYVKSQFFDKANQQAQPKLALRNIADTVIALPPKDEQHRIVAKVDELMALVNRLKAGLAESRIRQAQLADTLIESALKAA